MSSGMFRKCKFSPQGFPLSLFFPSPCARTATPTENPPKQQESPPLTCCPRPPPPLPPPGRWGGLFGGGWTNRWRSNRHPGQNTPKILN